MLWGIGGSRGEYFYFCAEKLYVFARHLRRYLPGDQDELPREVQQNIDMESYRIQQTGSGKIALERRPGVLEPMGTKGTHGTAPEELETLSRIIAELNERFGLNLGPEHRVTLGQMMEKLDDDAALDAAARVNTRENVRLTFDQKVEHVIQEIVDSNFELYKRITDDRAFGEALKNFLFDQYLRAHRNAEELIKVLRIRANRARQAEITTAITEIVGGADAVDRPHHQPAGGRGYVDAGTRIGVDDGPGVVHATRGAAAQLHVPLHVFIHGECAGGEADHGEVRSMHLEKKRRARPDRRLPAARARVTC